MSKKITVNQLQLDLDIKSKSVLENPPVQTGAVATILSLSKKLELKAEEQMLEADKKLRQLYADILKGVEHIK